MPRLKNRQSQIPGGMKMKVAPLKFQSRPYSSFDTIVNDLMRQVRANPLLAKRYNYPTERHKIEEWVDSYNATICENSGWLDYIEGGPDGVSLGDAPPKWLPAASLAKYGARLVAGAASLLSWLGSGMAPVKPELSTSRASICANCPKNRQADLRDIFIRSTSEMIRRQIEFAHEVGLKTPDDARLGICDACACPLKLMVHVPIEDKVSHMDADTWKALDEKCWIPKEKAQYDRSQSPEKEL